MRSQDEHTHTNGVQPRPPFGRGKNKQKTCKYKIGNKSEYLQLEQKILINYWNLGLRCLPSETFLGNVPELLTQESFLRAAGRPFPTWNILQLPGVPG